MAKYLIFVPPHKGHIIPTIAVGSSLQSRGHSVKWITLLNESKDLFPKSLTVECPLELQACSEEVQQIMALENSTSHSIREEEMIGWAFDNIWLALADLMNPVMETILIREDPDLIIHDEGLKAPALWAKKMHIPHVTSISSLPGLHLPGAILAPVDDQWLSKTMKTYCSENGLQTNNGVFNSDQLSLVYSYSEFCEYHDFPNYYHFVGPSINELRTSNEIEIEHLGSPLIYVSLGTLLDGIKKHVFQKLADVLSNIDAQFIVSADPSILEKWPDNFRVNLHWPQLRVLSKADAFITHGGFNSVNEAIYYGVPMLVLPMAVDQFTNARLVESAGIGIKRRLKRINEGIMEDDLSKLLNDSTIRSNIKRLSQEQEYTGGLVEAVNKIQQLTPIGTT